MWLLIQSNKEVDDMGDIYDDFDDDFEDDEPFEDVAEDTYGEHLDEFEPEESFEDEVESKIDEEPMIESEPIQDEPECDRFTGTKAFILGGARGWAYEDGMEEKERRRLEKEMDSKRRRQKRNNTDQ